MKQTLFLRIFESVCAHDLYFLQKQDAISNISLSSIQKCTSTLHILAYIITPNVVDEYCQMGKNTIMEEMKGFVKVVKEIFETKYLRQLTRDDIERQLKVNKAQRFLGMFATLDCMHYQWKNCPIVWQRQFQDKNGNRSIIFEVIANRSF
jgi:hypothetical protein